MACNMMTLRRNGGNCLSGFDAAEAALEDVRQSIDLQLSSQQD